MTKTLSKLVGLKISIQDSVDFLYSNNDHSEKEIRKRIPIISLKKLSS
jgi:hypothetical protein